MSVSDQSRMTEAGAALANTIAYMDRVADKKDPNFHSAREMAHLAFETLVPNKEQRKTLIDRVEEVLRQTTAPPPQANETPAA